MHHQLSLLVNGSQNRSIQGVELETSYTACWPYILELNTAMLSLCNLDCNVVIFHSSTEGRQIGMKDVDITR